VLTVFRVRYLQHELHEPIIRVLLECKKCLFREWQLLCYYTVKLHEHGLLLMLIGLWCLTPLSTIFYDLLLK